MKTVIFCPHGFERGVFTLGVLDYFQEKNFHAEQLIATSTGAFPAVFFAAGLTKECKEEFERFDMKNFVRPYSWWIRLFKLHTMPSLVRSEGFREVIINAIRKHDVRNRLRSKVFILATNLTSGDSPLFEINGLSDAELTEILMAAIAVEPIWPPVWIGAQLVDGVFADQYFAHSVIKNPQDRFIICTGDPRGAKPKLTKKLNSLVSIHLRTTDLLCGQKIAAELDLLEQRGFLNKNVFVVSATDTIPRVSLFRKTKEEVATIVNVGRKAAEEFLKRQ